VPQCVSIGRGHTKWTATTVDAAAAAAAAANIAIRRHSYISASDPSASQVNCIREFDETRRFSDAPVHVLVCVGDAVIRVRFFGNVLSIKY